MDADRRTTDQSTGESTDQADHTPDAHSDYRDELIEELRDRVRFLEESNRENRRIIAGLVQRVPELEAADGRGEGYGDGRESHEEPVQDDEKPDEGYTPTESSAEPQTGAQRPWWRRIFGGG